MGFGTSAVTSFNLTCPFKDPSPNSHFLRCWGSGLQHRNFGEQDSAQSTAIWPQIHVLLIGKVRFTPSQRPQQILTHSSINSTVQGLP